MASFFVSVKPQESRTADFCAWTENGKGFLFEGRKRHCSAYKKEVPGGLVCGRLRADAHVAQEFLYLRMDEIILVKCTAV